MSRLFVFLHMPKTGGHTFRYLVMQRYGTDKVLQINDYDEMISFLNSPFKNYFSALHGHMPYGIDKYIDSSCEYYVMLRNPVDRFISEFYHIYNTKEHPVYEILHKQGITPLDYSKNTHNWKDYFDRTINGQTRRLGIYDLIKKDENNRYWWLLADARNRLLLEEAKDVLLNKIQNFGIFEYFDDSIDDFCKLIAHQRPYNIPKINVSKKRIGISELDSRLIDRIKSENEYDMELYKFALKIFQNKISLFKPLLYNNKE